jgi:fructose-bisphosphate aldolase class II
LPDVWCRQDKRWCGGFQAGKAALLHTLCRDTSGELVDALALMEQACEEAIIPYLQASGAIGKA